MADHYCTPNYLILLCTTLLLGTSPFLCALSGLNWWSACIACSIAINYPVCGWLLPRFLLRPLLVSYLPSPCYQASAMGLSSLGLCLLHEAKFNNCILTTRLWNRKFNIHFILWLYIYNFMCCTKPNLYLTREIDPQRWAAGVFGINMLVYIIYMSCWWYYLLWNLVCKFLILEYIANSSFHWNPTNRNNS